jgi:hypothetical protein
MISRRLVCFGLTAMLGIAWTWPALGQMGYNPARGPISPWMNMFQRRVGPLDNYNSWVRPQLQLQDAMARQNVALQQQATGLQLLGQQIEAKQGNQVRPTGTGSVFMNYFHYYPSFGSPVPTRVQLAPRAALPQIPGTRFAR